MAYGRIQWSGFDKGFLREKMGFKTHF
ncbi:MAG: hypothetical protein ACJAYJ_000738, partial [Saprospiraceae bacterium]